MTLMDKRTHRPFRVYKASPSWLEEEQAQHVAPPAFYDRENYLAPNVRELFRKHWPAIVLGSIAGFGVAGLFMFWRAL
jgi:hypothetical protein